MPRLAETEREKVSGRLTVANLPNVVANAVGAHLSIIPGFDIRTRPREQSGMPGGRGGGHTRI